MLARLQRAFWRIVAMFGPQSWLLRVLHRKARALKDELEGDLTDKFVELLLYAMDLAFILLASYRRNLRDFRGNYVLRTMDGRVAASALFSGGKLSVRDQAVSSPNVTVTFKNPAAFRRFLFSRDQDILLSIMANEVEVDGNLNYVYKFGFMARELTLRLGLQ
jgi:hypothetical protein